MKNFDYSQSQGSPNQGYADPYGNPYGTPYGAPGTPTVPTTCSSCGADLSADPNYQGGFLCSACQARATEAAKKEERKGGAGKIVLGLIMLAVYSLLIGLSISNFAAEEGLKGLVFLLCACLPAILLYIAIRPRSRRRGSSSSYSNDSTTLGIYLLICIVVIVLGILLTPILSIGSIVKGGKQIAAAKATAA